VVDGRKPGVDSRDEGKYIVYWKERSVIRREDDVDGRASVIKDEERVWTVMRLCRHEGWVVVRTL